MNYSARKTAGYTLVTAIERSFLVLASMQRTNLAVNVDGVATDLPEPPPQGYTEY